MKRGSWGFKQSGNHESLQLRQIQAIPYFTLQLFIVINHDIEPHNCIITQILRNMLDTTLFLKDIGNYIKCIDATLLPRYVPNPTLLPR